MMVLGGVLVFIFARPLIALFTDDIRVIEVGVGYLRVEALILPAYVLSFISGAVLQGMKRPVIPMYFNIIRQLLLPLTFISIALAIIETDIYGIWWSIAIATWLTASIQYLHMKRFAKQRL
jgi:Na+-driven multidrug efflux pump